jgi:uncharacterized protein YegL
MQYVVAFFILLVFGGFFLLLCLIAIMGHAYQAEKFAEQYYAKQRSRYKPYVRIMADKEPEQDRESYDGSEYVDGNMFGSDWIP